MSKPYEKRLEASHKLLANPSQEVMQEGYDSLFNLWLEYVDSPNFKQDLILIAAEHENILQEFQKRLDELSLKDTITDTFLKKHLGSLASEVSKHKLVRLEEYERAKEVSREKEAIAEKQVMRFPWWNNLFVSITLIIIVLVSAINLLYVFPRKNNVIAIDSSYVKVSYKTPIYLSLGDLNTIDVYVSNGGNDQFSGIITLLFENPDLLVTPVSNQSLTVEVAVPPQSSKTTQFKFLVFNKPSHGNLNYFIQISSKQSEYRSSKENFQIAPIPYLRAATNWLLGTLGTLVITLFGDQLRKLIKAK